MKNLFVGNLPFTATEDELRDMFSAFGEVQQVRIMTDRDTGKSRGFAFVEMADDDAAAKAVTDLNGRELGGRALTINEARPKPERRGGFGAGGGGGFGGKRRGGSGGSGGGGGRGGSRSGPRTPREPRW
ncbi:MAG TPA: RNA-binding protein [Terriglobia bacterium]|nr:RNA-binding protein [Terriglobia bacterium]